jgi:hypothetical protein
VTAKTKVLKSTSLLTTHQSWVPVAQIQGWIDIHVVATYSLITEKGNRLLNNPTRYLGYKYISLALTFIQLLGKLSTRLP